MDVCSSIYLKKWFGSFFFMLFQLYSHGKHQKSQKEVLQSGKVDKKVIDNFLILDK